MSSSCVEGLRRERGVQRGEALRVGERARASRPARHHLAPGRGDRRGDVGGERRLVADEAAEQQDHRELLGLGQPGVAQRGAGPSSSQATWFGVTGGPLIGIRSDPRVAAQRVVVGPRPAREAVAPVRARRRRGRGGPERGVDHQREQLVLRRDVAVERHRRRRRARAATRLIETAREALGAATSTPAATIRSSVSPGFGPARGALAQAPGRLDARGQPARRSRARLGSVDRHRPTAYNVRSICVRHTQIDDDEVRDDRQSGDRGRAPSRSPTATCACSTASTCGSSAAACSRCSAPTARARRRPCGSSPRCIAPRRGPGARRRLRRRRRPPARCAARSA